MFHFISTFVRNITGQPPRRLTDKLNLDMLHTFRTRYDHMLETAHTLAFALGNGLNTEKKVERACNLFGEMYLDRLWIASKWKTIKSLFKDNLISEATFQTQNLLQEGVRGCRLLREAHVPRPDPCGSGHQTGRRRDTLVI